MSHTKCPWCHGTGRVSTLTNPNEPNKVSAGWGSLRCGRCHGQGIVNGIGGGGGGGAGAGSQLMAIVMGLFLYPVYSFFGFWLICTVLLLTSGEVLGPSIGLHDLPPWYFFSATIIPVAFTEYFQPDNIVINSVAAPVPVPAPVWLFGSALLGLGWIRRRQLPKLKRTGIPNNQCNNVEQIHFGAA